MPSLTDILENDDVEIPDVEENGPASLVEAPVDPAFCVECTDMPSLVYCTNCDERFCQVCFRMIHSTGRRKTHKVTEIEGVKEEAAIEEETREVKQELPADTLRDSSNSNAALNSKETNELIMAAIKKQARYTPLRLTAEERQLFKLLDAALNVSDYTNRVDTFLYTSKMKRIVEQLKLVCLVLVGLVVSKNMKIGQELIVNKSFKDNEKWYQNIFEIGRRYKILNPNRFNDNFGKLMYMVMDLRMPEIKNQMEFDLYKPIKTVASYLESRDDGKAMAIFDEPLIINATAEILSRGKSRAQINSEIKMKEQAIEVLAKKYSSSLGFTAEEIRQVLYLIGDLNSHVNLNRAPLERMIERLAFFKDKKDLSEYSLGIRVGRDGARLSHDHGKQYDYVLLSLTLWSIVQREMIQLWSLADDDLLSDSAQYRLTETGQGLNRVKPCPKLYRAMYTIVEQAKKRAGFWVGSLYIHLGDSTVPNALFFLDKYLQVSKILNPIDRCLLHIEDEFVKDEFVKELIEKQFGSVETLEKRILRHFFTKAFNGSGAEDFFSAGSCVDGRLTSTWEWANQVHKYDYFKFFLLSGFTGFNGDL